MISFRIFLRQCKAEICVPCSLCLVARCRHFGHLLHIILLVISPLMVQEFHFSLYFPHRFRVVFVHLLPCISLVILNCLLLSGMRKADRRKVRLGTSTMVRKTDVVENHVPNSRWKLAENIRLLRRKCSMLLALNCAKLRRKAMQLIMKYLDS